MRVPLLILIALTTLANCQSCTFERENEEIEFIVDAQKVDLIDPILGQAQVECNGELKNVWRSCRFCDFQIINAASLSVRYLEVDSLHSEFGKKLFFCEYGKGFSFPLILMGNQSFFVREPSVFIGQDQRRKRTQDLGWA